jgi:hypothetical protein
VNQRIVYVPELLIVVGSCLFVFVLGVSAYFEHDIQWLHFFQSWMYIAAVWLSLRRSRWGYFIGISAAAFWDYGTVFVNTFLRSGLHWMLLSINTGKVQHVDQIVAVPAWLGNLLVVVGCVWAYTRLRKKRWTDMAIFGLALILTTGFFAAVIALFQPRYLPLFRGILHPHAPW